MVPQFFKSIFFVCFSTHQTWSLNKKNTEIHKVQRTHSLIFSTLDIAWENQAENRFVDKLANSQYEHFSKRFYGSHLTQLEKRPNRKYTTGTLEKLEYLLKRWWETYKLQFLLTPSIHSPVRFCQERYLRERARERGDEDHTGVNVVSPSSPHCRRSSRARPVVVIVIP